MAVWSGGSGWGASACPGAFAQRTAGARVLLGGFSLFLPHSYCTRSTEPATWQLSPTPNQSGSVGLFTAQVRQTPNPTLLLARHRPLPTSSALSSSCPPPLAPQVGGTAAAVAVATAAAVAVAAARTRWGRGPAAGQRLRAHAPSRAPQGTGRGRWGGTQLRGTGGGGGMRERGGHGVSDTPPAVIERQVVA